MYEFDYLRATSLDAASRALAEDPEARAVAGGMTLLPSLKLRLAQPTRLIDLGGIDGIDGIRAEKDRLVIGAMTCHADVASSADVQRLLPALAVLAEGIGDPQVRNRGTLGGSIAGNDPAADYPAAVLGLGASVRTTEREITAEEFFTGMFETALGPAELVKEVDFPLPKRAGYAKFPNPASRYAVVGVMVADFGREVRVAVTGAGPCVFRAAALEQALTRKFAPESLEGVGVDAEGLNNDLHASAEYRASLVTVMARRALAAALAG